MQTTEERKFVCKMEHWAVLWPARSNNREVIPTFIDVNKDPIVAQLTRWLRDTTGEAPPPAYPAVGVVDKRPEELLPPELRAMDADVLPFMRSSCTSLNDLCDTFLTYYISITRPGTSQRSPSHRPSHHAMSGCANGSASQRRRRSCRTRKSSNVSDGTTLRGIPVWSTVSRKQ